MSSAAKKLREKAKRFHTEVFPEYRELFQSLASGQKPATLLITCADSRVVPALVTGAKPGEVFVERNPGALVPVYSEQAVGVSASIEYALEVLGVKHVVVCGHSDCGAMKAALHPEKAANLPAVGRWLSFAGPAAEMMSEAQAQAAPGRQLAAFTRHCIRLQLTHLLTHPSVRSRVEAGKVDLVGAYWELHHGRVTWVRAAQSALSPKLRLSS